MQYVIWGLLLLLLLEVLVFFYIYIYLPLKRVRELTENLAEGKIQGITGLRGALGMDALVQNLQKIDATITKLGYHVSTERLNLHTVLASIVEGVMVVDTDHNIKLVNEELMKLFNLTDSPVEKTIKEALHKDEIEEIVASAIQQNQRISKEIYFDELTGRHIFEINAVPLIDAISRQCIGVATTFHDISTIKNLDNIRREFISNVSHELRTPLSIFKSYLETLLANPDWMQEDALKMTQVLQRHSERLNSLVDDLLTLSRMESGQVHLEMKPIGVGDFLKRIKEEWSKLSEKKWCKLELELDNHLPIIMADALRLEQVLSNLIENALNYSNPNSVIKVCAFFEKQDKVVKFFVKDQGAGIPSDKLPRIFDRFFRADPARSRALGGTGLGLSIVKSIVELHKGKIWAESEVGKGTIVFFTIPSTDSDPQAPWDHARQPSVA